MIRNGMLSSSYKREDLYEDYMKDIRLQQTSKYFQISGGYFEQKMPP